MQVKLLDVFKRELWDLNNHWFLFKDLYGNHNRVARRNVVNPSSPMLFDLVKLRFHDHILMQISKLLDPSSTGRNDNLSVNRLIDTLGPFSENTTSKITLCMSEINENKTSITLHRNKRISHNDLGNKLEYSLPKVEISEITIVMDNLGIIFNLISAEKNNTVHEFFPRSIDKEYSANYLIEILTAGRESLGLSTQ